MRFRNLKKWAVKEELEGLIFFAQRMEELLFDYSLDSYKAPTLNTPSLIKETLNLIEDIETETIDIANLKHLLKELSENIKKDPIAKSLISLDVSKYIFDNFENEFDTHKLSPLKLRLEILSKELDPYRYLNKTFELLRTTIEKKEKKKIDYLAKALCTNLINIGISKIHLYDQTISFFYRNDETKIESVEALNAYFKKIFPFGHQFVVHFKASELIKEVSESISSFHIEISEKLQDKEQKFANQNQFKLKKGEVYVTVKEIQSLDIVSAMVKAENRLSKLGDLFLLFYHKNKISWSEKAIVEQCCTDELRIAYKPKRAVEKGLDQRPQKASKNLNDLIKRISFRSNKKGFQQFNRAVDLHGMSVCSDIVENQLLSLWASLETISPSKPNRNKINNIIDQIIPFIMLSYARRLISRFGNDLLIWNDKVARSIVSSVPDTKGLSYYEKCLFLLAIDSNKDIRKELYSALGDFHLLRYRAFRLHEVLSNKKGYYDFMKEHERRVSWQIRRIYRTRNLIIHSGNTPDYTASLVENAHDYLDQVLSMICVLSCSNSRFDTFDQIFEFTSLQYEKLNNFLSDEEIFTKENLHNIYWDY